MKVPSNSGNPALFVVPESDTPHEARKYSRTASFACLGKALRACGTSRAGEANQAGLPNIMGQVNGAKEVRIADATGCFTALNRYDSGMAGTQGSDYHNFSMDASLSSPIYGNSDTVMPKSVNYAIIIYLGS